MLKKLTRFLILILVLAGIGCLFVFFIYPTYINKPDNLTVSENSTGLAWYDPQIPNPPALTIYEAHDQSYFAWNMMDQKLSFVSKSGSVVWDKLVTPGSGPYYCNTMFFNTKEGTYTMFYRDGAFHLDYYDMKGNLVSEKEAPMISCNHVLDVREEEPGFFDFLKKADGPEFFYGMQNGGLFTYTLVNYENEEIFSLKAAMQILDMYKVAKDLYLVNYGNQLVMIDNKGNQVWRKEYNNIRVIDYNFSGHVLLTVEDSFAELISFDGERDLKLENCTNVVKNRTEDNTYFYTVSSAGDQLCIDQYDINLTKKTLAGPFKNISSFIVNGNCMMFIGSTETESFIYKLRASGEEILKYPNNGHSIGFFNDTLTLISDAESKMSSLNPDGTIAWTDEPYEVQGFYPTQDGVVYIFRDNNMNYSLQKLDNAGKKVFTRGTYEYIPSCVYTSIRSKTVYGYWTVDGRHLVILDETGKVMMDRNILGIEAEVHNSMMPTLFITNAIYLGSAGKMTKISFDQEVLYDRLMIN